MSLPLELTGILGWAESVLDAIGTWGGGLLVALETVFPPIPSEAILPLAGFLSTQGRLSLPLVILAATVGSYLGAMALYGLGSMLGLERSIAALSKLPLVDREDFEKAADWFDRHGKASVFFGRLIPGVRSLISLPAGAKRMNLGSFSLLTLAGSGIWNGLLIGLGALLGTQYQLVDRYSGYLNYVLWAALLAFVGWLVLRRVRQRRQPG